MKKEFNLMEILSGISGYLLTDRFDRVHELIEWVMGGAVFTHQIPDIADEFKKRLSLQFPQLSNLQSDAENLARDIRRKDITDITVSTTKHRLQQKYGNVFQVTKG